MLRALGIQLDDGLGQSLRRQVHRTSLPLEGTTEWQVQNLGVHRHFSMFGLKNCLWDAEEYHRGPIEDTQFDLC